MNNTERDIEIAKLSKEESKTKPISKNEYDRKLAEWQMFFLYNLDMFVEEILGIKLHFFQRQLLLMMWDSEIFAFIGSRAIGKSFIVSIFVVAVCLLLPNYKVTICSKTKGQGNIIVEEKIKKLLSSNTGLSKILNQLVKDGYIEFGTDRETGGAIVKFGNGAEIQCAFVGESMRGTRTNLLITDECCLIKKKDYDEIAEPLTEKYSFNGLEFEPKQIFLSSPRDKNSWFWTYLKKMVHDHYKGKKEINFFAGDIYCAVANKIQTAKQFNNKKNNSDPYAWEQEYLCIWHGDKEDAIFKRQDFIDSQVLNCTYYPPNLNYDFTNKIEYNENEVRFLCVDLALSGGQANDLTVLMYCIAEIDTGNIRVEYISTFSGMNANEQVLRFKKALVDFNASYFVYDAKGIGVSITDVMMAKTEDYGAWTVNTDKSLMMCSQPVLEEKISRCVEEDALDVMIPIVSTSDSNSKNHYNLWSYLRNKKIKLLKDCYTREYELQDETPTFVTKDSSEKAEILLPYKQTDLLINESCNLEIIRNGLDNITVKEKSGALKDRFMCLGYACAFANKLYNKYQVGYLEDFDIDDYTEAFNI